MIEQLLLVPLTLSIISLPPTERQEAGKMSVFTISQQSEDAKRQSAQRLFTEGLMLSRKPTKESLNH